MSRLEQWLDRIEDGRPLIYHPVWVLPAVFAAAAAVRLFMSALAYASTFDTSTVGLMAVHILRGETPAFYYGQSYMGALEAYVAALFFAFFGVSDFVLSFSPIFFSVLWVGATYLLFRELFDARAGTVAALCVAVPGWETLWYGIGSYGGYPAAFFFGTMALWLAARMAFRDLGRLVTWAHAAGLGLCAALGVWTHYLAGAYLLTGAVLLLVRLARDRFRPRLLLPCAAAGAIAVVGLVPALVSFGTYGGEQVVRWNLSWGFIKHNVLMLARRNLPRFLFWPIDVPDRLGGEAAAQGVNGVVFLCLALAAALYLLRLVSARDARRRWRMLVPVLFGVLFLATYLPHSLAFYKAPRYIIPLGMMTVCSILGVSVAMARRALRGLGWVLVTVWIGYNAAGALYTAVRRAPDAAEERARRERLVALAREAGLKNVAMVGGPIFGHEGQTLSLYAKGEIRFVSVFDERYQPAAEAFETDEKAGLACERAHLEKVEAALEALRARYRVIEDRWICLFYDLQVPLTSRRAVPPARMRITVQGADQADPALMLDRVRETVVEARYDRSSGFTIDLGRRMRLDSLWLYAPDPLQFGLPDSYTISSSLDGATFRRVADVRERMAVAYACGDRPYLKGYFGLLECRFEAEPARYVRFACRAGQGDREAWSISEVFAFERLVAAPGSLEEDAHAMAEVLGDRRAPFTIGDRWVSARLNQELAPLNGGGRAYPRFNPKYKATLMSREVVPSKGTALAVATGVADECMGLLRACYGQEAEWDRFQFGQYTLLVFTKEVEPGAGAARLIWNGHTLLKTREPEAEWY